MVELQNERLGLNNLYIIKVLLILQILIFCLDIDTHFLNQYFSHDFKLNAYHTTSFTINPVRRRANLIDVHPSDLIGRDKNLYLL